MIYTIYILLFIFLFIFIKATISKYKSHSISDIYTWNGKSIECIECNDKLELVLIKNHPQYEIFIRKESDTISNYIRAHGDWSDCVSIRKLWYSLPGLEKGDYFLDAGANIGICTFDMLNRGIKSISIEPIPNNLHVFTKSLLYNKKWIKNITVYKVGLGKEKDRKNINILKGNWGGSSLIYLQQNYITYEINIIKLDTLLKYFTHKIHLASVDIQGYELFMLEGAQETLKRKIIRHYFMEIWCEALFKANITEIDIYNMFEKYNYVLNTKRKCNKKASFNIIASLKLTI